MEEKKDTVGIMHLSALAPLCVAFYLKSIQTPDISQYTRSRWNHTVDTTVL